MSGPVPRRADDDRGVVFVLMALMLTTLLVMVAFAIDLGNARQFRRQAQATADTAALAGVAELNGASEAARSARAVSQVKLYAQRNFNVEPTAWNGCDAAVAVPPGWVAPDSANDNRCILIDSANTKVRITHLPVKPVLTFFARAVGMDRIGVTAAATAIVQSGGASSCGFCVLGPFNAQNGDISVSGHGGAAINGDAETKANGELVVTGGGITLYNGGRVISGNFSPTPDRVPEPLVDPLSGIPVPDTSGPLRSGCGQGPGVYLSLPVGCPLAPGLYVVIGPNHISGTSAIDATSGVTIYFTCRSGNAARPCASGGEPGADLVCTGQSRFDAVAPPREAEPVGRAVPGLAVFFDRNNTGVFDCRGNGGSGLQGTLYGARATLMMRGNGECTFDHSLVVIGAVDFRGNPSGCRVTYDPAENVDPPSSVALLE